MKGILMSDLLKEIKALGANFFATGDGLLKVGEADLNDPLVIIRLLLVSNAIKESMTDFQNSLGIHINKKVEELS